MLKKSFIVLVLAVLLGVSTAYAGWGGGSTGYNTNNNLPVYNICAGEQQTITGVISNSAIPGNGLVINTANGDVTVYGLGPIWYWEKQNVGFPEIGEVVTAVISPITTKNYNVILSMTIGSETIQLRDPATCLPLWRGGIGKR